MASKNRKKDLTEGRENGKMKDIAEVLGKTNSYWTL